jgi:hypothetical protein
MQLDKVTIKNFKAIEETTINLGAFAVIVGTNGSGKSSILQDLHWVFQFGCNLEDKQSCKGWNSDIRGFDFVGKDATYMPLPANRNAGHGAEYGNLKGTPQLDVDVETTTCVTEAP